MVPSASVLPGLLALLLGVPLLLGVLLRRARPALLAAALLAALAVSALGHPRLLLALGEAGRLGLVLLGALGLLFCLFERFWGEHVSPVALAVPVAAGLAALIAVAPLQSPRAPIEAQARFLAELRADPALAWEPASAATGRKSAAGDVAFSLLAWPLAPVFGDLEALQIVAALALAIALLLTHLLARAAGLGGAAALLAQAGLLLLPAASTRMAEGLYPAQLFETLLLLLMIHLLRRFPRLDGARDTAAACAFLVLAQSGGPGALLQVAAFVGSFALWELAWGERSRVARLLGAYGAALLIALLAFRVRFLPAEARELMELRPGAHGLLRLFRLYDLVFPLLALIGAQLLPPASLPRRLLLSALLAGLAMAFLLPGPDAALVAAGPPLAVLAGAAAAWLWRRGRLARLAVALAALYAIHTGVARALRLFGARLV